MSTRFSKDHPLRLAVLISGGGSTLRNLIRRVEAGHLTPVRIVQVISSRATVPGVGIAREADLPLAIVRRRDYADGVAFSDAISGVLDAAEVDLVVLAGFLCHWQLPERYRGRTLNIHPALLPEFGGQGMFGCHVHAAVLAAGRAASGCTVHLVDEHYDHGPIVAQTCVPVMPGDTAATLAERVAVAERELYPYVIQQVVDHGIAWLAQFEHTGGKSTH